jgi:intracellular septation protein A
MTLFTVVPSTLNDYVVYNLPHRLVVHWMVAGLITLVLMGLAAAAILKKPRAA